MWGQRWRVGSAERHLPGAEHRAWKALPQCKEEPVARWAHRDRTLAEIPLSTHPVLGAGAAVAARWERGPCGTWSSLSAITGARNQPILMKAAGSSATPEPVFRKTRVCGLLTQKWGREEEWHICC